MSSDELRGHSIGELLKQLSEQTATLVRQELDLAKAEMQQKARRAGVGLGMIGRGRLRARGRRGTHSDADHAARRMDGRVARGADRDPRLRRGRSRACPPGQGKVSEAGSPIPEQTVETVKEDVQWAKSQIKSGDE